MLGLLIIDLTAAATILVVIFTTSLVETWLDVCHLAMLPLSGRSVDVLLGVADVSRILHFLTPAPTFGTLLTKINWLVIVTSSLLLWLLLQSLLLRLFLITVLGLVPKRLAATSKILLLLCR